MEERKIYGPPGCGKTTYLMETAIPPAVERFGPDKVMVTSFSKAAAYELARASSSVNPANVGTLHSICYRAMSSPPIAETHSKLWNEHCPRGWAITGETPSGLEDGVDDYYPSTELNGDTLLNAVNVYRAKLIPTNQWPTKLLDFYRLWTKFKNDAGCVDFTDMIEQAVEQMLFAPGQPEVIFVDEAQDLTPLQLKLVRSWGLQAKWFVLVGDDDQAIFSFMGADPRVFIKPSGYEKKEPLVLDRSYRVPAEVLHYAQWVIHYVRHRHEKTYRPRLENGSEVQGRVIRTDWTSCHEKEIVDVVKEYVGQNKSVMYLTTCSYMLDPVKQQLIDEAVPFHNPYRSKRGDWNPLARGGKDRTSARDLLVNFLTHGEDGGYWSIEQFIAWAKFLKVGDNGLIRKQGKAGLTALADAVKSCQPGLHTCRNVISDILAPAAVEAALQRNTKWLVENLQARRMDSLSFPLQIAQKHGLSALVEKPKCIIGTIHSVKGGEADCVIMAPDLSAKAMKSFAKQESRDNIYRVYYVGATRAREELMVLSPAIQKSGHRSFHVRRNPVKI